LFWQPLFLVFANRRNTETRNGNYESYLHNLSIDVPRENVPSTNAEELLEVWRKTDDLHWVTMRLKILKRALLDVDNLEQSGLGERKGKRQ
jgi:hypothetical protein